MRNCHLNRFYHIFEIHPTMSKEAEDFYTSLCELTPHNNKPHISMLTMLAGDYIRAAPSIVSVIENHIKQVQGEKLHFLYLIDSIVKTVGGDYIPLFARNMPAIFSSVFIKADEKTRLQLHKLRNTWVNVFPAEKLYQLDKKVNSVDGNWPVAPIPVPKIHVNPHFVKALGTGLMREKLLKEKRDLLELEQRKVQLQILQTKEALEKEQRKLEALGNNLKSDGAYQFPIYAVKAPMESQPPSQKRKLDLILSNRDPRLMNKDTSSTLETAETKKPCLRNPHADSSREVCKEPVNKEPLPILPLQPLPAVLNVEENESVSDNGNIVCQTTNSSVTDTATVSAPAIPELLPEVETTSTTEIPLENVEPSDSLPDTDVANTTVHDVTDMVIGSEDELEVSIATPNDLPSDSTPQDTAPLDTDVISTKVVDACEVSHNSPGPLVENSEENKDEAVMLSLIDSINNTIECSKLERSQITLDGPVSSVQPWSPKEREQSLTPVSLSSESYPSPKSVSSAGSYISLSDSPTKTDDNYHFTDESDVEIMESKPVLTSSPIQSSGDSGKDVDLRSSYLSAPNAVSPKEPVLTTDLNTENVMIGLFGVKDVDLRQAPPPLPSPPPPPYISEDISNNKTWAKIKQTDLPRTEKQDSFSPRVKRDKDRLGRPCLNYNTDTISKSRGKQSEERAIENYNFIITEAQEQLQNGIISFVEYNTMLNEVVAINEEQKIIDAKKGCYLHEDEEFSEYNVAYDSPSEENGSDRKEEVNDHPAYDDRTPRPNRYYSRKHYDRQPYARGNRWIDRGKHRRGGHDGSRIPTTPPPPMVGPMPWKSQPKLSPMDKPVPENISQSPPFTGIRTNVPLADRKLLESAELVADDYICIGDLMRAIRFYGDIGVVMLSWDDPREICFQPGARHLIIDNVHKFLLQFGGQSSEVTLDGFTSYVRLGRPTRELFVDDKYYSIGFGAPPVDIIICGKTRSIMLEGPPPVVRYGQIKRTDLCGGTVNLIRDGKVKFPVYLDGKPQKFDIEGVPCVLQFVDKLNTVLINGAPVPIIFGGHPVPIMFQGREHFLRLTMLPAGILPGQNSIRSLDSQQSGATPSPVLPTPVPDVCPVEVPAPPLPIANQHPLDILASVLSTKVKGRVSGVSYNTEDVPEPAAPPSTDTSDKSVNIGELYRKLLNSGLVSTNQTTEAPAPKANIFLPDVSLTHPETLKKRPSGLINQLYEGIQCCTCGVRFPSELGTKKYSNHLDWHFRQNRRERASARTPHSRNWYYDLSDLIQLQDVEDLEEGIDLNEDNEDDVKKDIGEELVEEQPSVPVGEFKNPKCTLCEDQFEEFFNDEKEEWHIRNAVIVEEGILHPRCLEEMKKKKATVISMETDVAVPAREVDTSLDTSFSNVEIIEISDSDVQTQQSDKSQETKENVENKVETIDVDLTEDDNPEDTTLTAGGGTEEVSKEVKTEDPHPSDDDDILQIEVIERKIESYDLLDDDDDKAGTDGDAKDLEKESGELDSEPITEVLDDDVEINFARFKIKKEKEVPIEIIDNLVPSYITTIDGNIIHEKTAPLVAPGRIKINISSAIINPPGGESPSSKSTGSSGSVCFPDPQELPEENLGPSKPGIDRSVLSKEPPIVKGKETSGLCMIM